MVSEREATRETTNGRRTATKGKSPYEAAALGFKNYWWPVAISKDVTRKPRAIKVCGEEIVLIRHQGKAYALADECAHRGTHLSLDRGEFPGACVITCHYHGWTYDLESGRCVAVIGEGPESGAVGKAGVKTYPLEERIGIIWLWMGGRKMSPVPLEEDVPGLLLGRGTIIKRRYRVKPGNWRWHAENVAAGHSQTTHKTAIRSIFSMTRVVTPPTPPELGSPEDDGSYWLGSGGIGNLATPTERRSSKPPSRTYYPGVGWWPTYPLWRRIITWGWVRPIRRKAVKDIGHFLSLRLPGIARIQHFPMGNWLMYEWYTPVDEDHYYYWQVAQTFPKNWLHGLLQSIKFYVWALPAAWQSFNNQDFAMVQETWKYAKRQGGYYQLSPLTRCDDFDVEWRKFCDEHARGEGYAFRPKQQEPAAAGIPAIAGGSEESEE